MQERNLISRGYLEENYINLKKSINQIAREIGRNEKTVKSYIILYNIEIRKKDFSSCFKICEYCGKEFSTVGYYEKANGKIYPQENKNAQFCSRSCQSKNTKKHSPRFIEKICFCCEKKFIGGPNKRYCSAYCNKVVNSEKYEKHLTQDFIFPENFNKELIRTIINNVGKTINYFTVLEYAGVKINKCGAKGNYFLCKCICGKERLIRFDQLLSENSAIVKKSCGCRGPKKYMSTKDYCSQYFKRLLRGAADRSLEVKIDVDYICNLLEKQDFKCKISGLPLLMNGINKTTTASLDRIDSSKGYTKENVQWVHKAVNKIKMNYTQDYFIELCKIVAKYNEN